jgi:hypothetical protein
VGHIDGSKRTIWLSRHWISLVQGASCVLAVIAGFWLPPPVGALQSEGGAWGRFSQFFAAIAVAVMLIPLSRWRAPQHRRGWAIAATLSAILALSTLLLYAQKQGDWTCTYAENRVVVGAELTTHGEKYILQNPGMSCDEIIWEHAGAVEEIWTKASIDARRNVLASIHMLTPALIGCFLLAVSQAVYVGRDQPGRSGLGTGQSMDRLRLRIFISYRRSDTEEIVGRLYERLIERVEPTSVFRDIHSIPAGEDYQQTVRVAVATSDVLLAVVGPRWLDVEDSAGGRRLDDPTDLVRLEIETALEHRIAIIPLLHKTPAPKRERLPASLAALSTRHALPLRDDPDFDVDVERLLTALTRIAQASGQVKA